MDSCLPLAAKVCMIFCTECHGMLFRGRAVNRRRRQMVTASKSGLRQRGATLHAGGTLGDRKITVPMIQELLHPPE